MSDKKSEAEIRLTQWLWRAFFGGLLAWGGAAWAAWYFGIESKNTLHTLITGLGTAGLTVSVGGVAGGFIKGIFDRIEDEREAQKARADAAKIKRQDNITFLRSVLDDIKKVHDIVEHARLLIDAHKSAKTYGEQVRSLPDAIIILHNVRRALDYETGPAPKLDTHIQAMIGFLKSITGEFQTRYITVSRLQSQDEANNRLLRAEAAKGDRKAPKDVTQMAWDEIKTFDCLKVLRHDCPFISKDVKQEELDALRGEAETGGWFKPDVLEAVAQKDLAATLLRRKYEILFLDHVDDASRALREHIHAEQARNLDDLLKPARRSAP